MSLTKTGIVLAISTFYILIALGIGFYGETFSEEVTIDERSAINYNNETDQAGGFFSKVANLKLFSFLGNIIIGIGALPIWLNTIIFTPLVVVISWILITSLSTFNGGD